jgi:hypothetical protein
VRESIYVLSDRARRQDSLERELELTAAFGVVGVLLYVLIKNLGLGKHGSAREGPGQLELPAASPLKDAQRLVFVMTRPTVDDAHAVMGFRGSDAKTYALEELIARVRAGGRSDVTLRTAGNVREGAVAAARDQLRQAGIEIWSESGARVSGNARGQYGQYGQYGSSSGGRA